MSVSNEIDRLRRILPLIGGRYSFSWILIIGSLPLLTIGFVVTEISQETQSRWWAYAVVALVGQLALGAVFLVARVGLQPRDSRESLSWWVVVAVYVVAAQLRVAVIELGLDAFDLSDDVLWGARAVNSAVMFPLLFGFSSLALEGLARYHDQRAQLVRSLVEGQSDLERQQRAVDTLRQGVVEQVDRDVADANRITLDALGTLEQSISDGSDVRPELVALVEESDRRWRRISHAAWNAVSVDIPRPSVADYVTVVAKSGPLSLITVALSGVFMYSLVLARALEPPVALVLTVMWIVGAVTVGWVVNRLGVLVSGVPELASVGGVLMFVALGGAFLLVPDLSSSQAAVAWTIHTTNILAGLILGFTPSLLRDRQVTLDVLRNRLDQSTIERLRTESELVVLAQQVATTLHSTTRADFLARMLTLQRALDRDDQDAALEAIKSLKESLSGGMTVASPEETHLDEFLENWSGFVTLERQIEPDILEGEAATAVTTIVADAVNNAIRHGSADWIRVELARSGSGVDVRVMNNGSLVGSGRGVGVGSKNLDRLATGGWELGVVGGKTRLEARVLTSRP